MPKKPPASTALRPKVLNSVLVGSSIAVVVLFILALIGAFEKTVEYSSYEFGNIGNVSPSPGDSDYELLVTFQSKGAFIADRKIHISVDFQAIRKIEELKISELAVVFPGSSPYPLFKGLPTYFPQGLARVVDGNVNLQFYSQSLGNQSRAHGEADIIYVMPQMAERSAGLPYDTNGGYSYNLWVNGAPQQADRILRRNDIIYVAPLETSLQLKSNNLFIALAIVAAYLAVVQIVVSLRKK